MHNAIRGVRPRASLKTNEHSRLRRYARILALFLLILTVTGCSQSARKADDEQLLAARQDGALSEDDEFDLFDEDMDARMVEVWDPLEGVNRVMFGINDCLYTVVLDPVFKTYEGIVPMSIRVGIDNFFANITTPARLINCLLQGKGEGADIEFRRFWINTTEGILGFGDPAFDKHGLEPVKEDLGQTLAVWGLGDGFYVVWPLLGPSTLRDTAGMVGDWYANPIPYLTSTDVAIAASGLKAVNKGSFHAGEYEVMFADEIEPYIAARQTYLQYRKKQIEE